MKKLEISSKVKSAAASAILGIAMAQGVSLLTTEEAQAQNGGCDPRNDYMCSLNGTTYSNMKWRS